MAYSCCKRGLCTKKLPSTLSPYQVRSTLHCNISDKSLMLWTEPNNAEKLVKVLAALGIDTVERITNVNNLTPFNGMLCMHYSCKETLQNIESIDLSMWVKFFNCFEIIYKILKLFNLVLLMGLNVISVLNCQLTLQAIQNPTNTDHYTPKKLHSGCFLNQETKTGKHGSDFLILGYKLLS